jgi:hypothetical protein
MEKGKNSIFAPYFRRLDPEKYKPKYRSKIYLNYYLDYDPSATDAGNN